MCFVSNFLFAVAMLINVNISDQFNLAFYTILTVSIPAFFITIFGRHTFSGLKEEFHLYHKKEFLLAAFTWCLMLISSVKAYQLGDVTIVAPLFALTSIMYAIVEYFFHRNKSRFLQKMVSALLLILAFVLVKM